MTIHNPYPFTEHHTSRAEGIFPDPDKPGFAFTLSGDAHVVAAVRRVHIERDRLAKSLVLIRANAESMLTAMAHIGTPENSDEWINTRWIVTEATDALNLEKP